MAQPHRKLVKTQSKLPRAELCIALAGTALSVIIHLIFSLHAGGLWRDEVNTVSVSSLPTLMECIKRIEYDSFPILWLLIMRFWSAIAGNNDSLFRLLGLLVGCSILIAVWFNARQFKLKTPLFALCLIGFSPSMIRWGDSMRAYGFGIILILLVFGLVWRVVENPTRKSFALATFASILAVQSLYYNSFLLLGICCAGAAVTSLRKQWKHSALILSIGAIAALTVCPYLVTFSNAKAWTPMFQFPKLWSGLGLSWFWTKLYETLSPAGEIYVWLFVISFFAAIAIGFLVFFFPKMLKANPQEMERALYASVALLIGAVAYYAFLRKLEYYMQPWYYLALIAFSASTFDPIFCIFDGLKSWRIVRLSTFALAVLSMSTAAWNLAHIRMTNLDQVATMLTKQASPKDLVVVNPWYCGITFARYYTPTNWTTLPPIEDHRYARVDLLKAHMTNPDQTAPVASVLSQIQETLKSGNRVWLVGSLQFLQQGQIPMLLPPAPNPSWGWLDGPYYQSWLTQAGYFVQSHATRVDPVQSPSTGPVSDYENQPVFMVSGWRD